MHHTSITLLATPVMVLARGPKRAHVKLAHALRWRRKDYPAGSTRYVPTHCLGNKPWKHAMVSIGRGSYARLDSLQARKAVARGR